MVWMWGTDGVAVGSLWGVQEVLGLIQKSVRRRVLFNDDIYAVTQALVKVGHRPLCSS